MLRFFVLLLVLANGLFFAWSQNLLRPYGFGPAQPGEPQRLAQQIAPESIRVLTPEEVHLLETAPQTNANAKPPECLQAGVFTEAQGSSLQPALQAALPDGAWSLVPATEPAHWVVFMGPYPTPEALAKKRGELAALNLRIESMTKPEFQNGLSLGGFESEIAAQQALAAVSLRGVRTARVVQDRPEVTGVMLKIPAVTEALKPALAGLKDVLGGRALRACN